MCIWGFDFQYVRNGATSFVTQHRLIPSSHGNAKRSIWWRMQHWTMRRAFRTWRYVTLVAFLWAYIRDPTWVCDLVGPNRVFYAFKLQLRFPDYFDIKHCVDIRVDFLFHSCIRCTSPLFSSSLRMQSLIVLRAPEYWTTHVLVDTFDRVRPFFHCGGSSTECWWWWDGPILWPVRHVMSCAKSSRPCWLSNHFSSSWYIRKRILWTLWPFTAQQWKLCRYEARECNLSNCPRFWCSAHWQC